MAVEPFAGRTVVVAASEGRVEKLAAELRHRGASVLTFPTVRLVPAEDSEPLDRALRGWTRYDWIVFTSTHGVDSVVQRAKSLGVDLRRIRGRIAAVGPATKATLEAAGLPVSVVPDEFLTDRIAASLGDVCGRAILLPRSRIARKSLARELRERGAIVTEVDAYDAVPAEPSLDSLRKASRVDFVLFTSASAATNFASLVPQDLLARIQATAEAACIGPVTAEAARDLGFRVTVVAEKHTIPGLIESLAEMTSHG